VNYLSEHSIFQKKGTIIGLVDKIFLLIKFKILSKKLEFVVKVLSENDYLLSFIFDTIQERIKSCRQKTFKQISEITSID